ncbi:MAG: hypothetical protein MI757_04280 [Pirellulales bacterium]|nr:hypothetical protein [Pirellulales bacterium]
MHKHILSVLLALSFASTGCHLVPLKQGKALNLSPAGETQAPAKATITPASAALPHTPSAMPPTGSYGRDNRGPLANPSCRIGGG